MTTIRYLPNYYTDTAEFTNIFIASATPKKVEFVDIDSYAQIILSGQNLDYEAGKPHSGTIEKLTIADEDGKPVEVISGFNVNAAEIGGTTAYEYIQYLFSRVIYGGATIIGTAVTDNLTGGFGKDIIQAGSGDDSLDGRHGTDTLTGGTGNDIFHFGAGYGKDTITDFDADGGTGLQDHIGANFADAVTIEKSGKNTEIDFGHGDILTLLNVHPSQIDASDFTG